jgi:hypothetical protein
LVVSKKWSTPRGVLRKEDAMLTKTLLWTAALSALGAAICVEAGENSAPNFTSANFGWLLSSGFDWMPVEGMSPPPGAPDPKWRGGLGLPSNDFNYQPPKTLSDPGRNGQAV